MTYDVESQRNEPVTVTVVDEVPGGDPRALEFHRGYGVEDWAVKGTRLVFERELAPSKAYETLYRLRDVPKEEIAGGLGKPVVDTEALLIEDPSFELRDPRAQATGGGPQTGDDSRRR